MICTHSTIPLLWGWKAVVSTCLMSRRLQVPNHKAEVNWAPLSIVTMTGMPKCANQLAMKASVHVLAPCCAEGQLPPTWLTCPSWSKDTHSHQRRLAEGLPGPRARGRTCVLAREWRGKELMLLVNFPPLAVLAAPAHGCHVLANTFPRKTCSCGGGINNTTEQKGGQ